MWIDYRTSSSLDPPETNLESCTSAQPLTLRHTSAALRFRHSGWQRDRQRVYDSLCRTHQRAQALDAFPDCGRHAYVLQSPDDPNVYKVAGSTCHHRFCLPCAQERSRRLAHNVLDHLAGKPARFLTLTIRSTTEPLSELLDKLSACYGRLRSRKFWKTHVTGGVSFIEVKWNDGLQRWNVHLHAIIQGRYMSVGVLSQLWKKITSDSLIVDIRAIKDERMIARYVTKYASKPLDHSVLHHPPKLDEAIVALKGRRLATTIGNWRGVLLTPKENEDRWIPLGSLDQMYRQASDGNARAQTILSSLNAPDVPTTAATRMTRAPPASSTLPSLQLNLPVHPTTTSYDQHDCNGG